MVVPHFKICFTIYRPIKSKFYMTIWNFLHIILIKFQEFHFCVLWISVFYRYISSSCTQHSRMWSINGSRLEKSSYWCHTYECWFFQVLLLLIALSPIVFLEYLQWVLLFASFFAFWKKEAKSGCLMLSSFTHPSLKYRL